MANSGPIPIYGHPQNHPNAYYNQAFSGSSLNLTNSPQSPPYYLDPRSPRTIFPVPASLQSPMRSTDQRNRPTEPLTDENYLHQNIIEEILGDVAHGLDNDIWGFLSYMEYNHCVVSTYTKGKEFLIDNSANPMDHTSLGLASLPGPARSSKAQRIRQAIHKGIILSSDEYGNIYLTNESKVPVIIKGFREPERFCISEEVIRLRGNIMPGNEIVKVFDIEEFRSQIGLQILKGSNNEEQLRNICLIRMCFSEAEPGLHSPCWLLLVNVTALNMIGNEEVRTEIQDYIAQLSVTSNRLTKKDLPSKKKKNEGNKEARRNTRIELRKQGERIQDHMKYSWDEVYYKKDASALDIETLKEQFEDPAIDYDDSEEDDENKPSEEAQLQVNVQRLKTIVRGTRATPVPARARPVKHWAKLSYIIKQHTGSEGAY